jgi:alkanesulfonate monooxygenase SsuD/methylene tetrahydromethanopterin reductase-like flavin-dependent oxidoreductase (luciferase family)
VPSHEFAIAEGCHVQVTPLAKDDTEVAALYGKFETALANHPGTARPQFMLLRHAFVAADDDEAMRAAVAIRRWYAYFLSWVVNRDHVKEAFLPPLTDAEMDARPDGTLAAQRANHVIGTPAEVIARLKRYEAMGVDQFSIWIDNSMSHADKKRMLERWVGEVCPAFAPVGATA